MAKGLKGVHLTPPEQTWPLKNFWNWTSDSTVTFSQTPYKAYGKGQNLDIRISLWIMVRNAFHRNLKGIIITFKQKLNVIYRGHGRVWSLTWLKNVSKMVIFFTFGCCGVRKAIQIFNQMFPVFLFRLSGIHFDQCKNQIQIPWNVCLFHKLNIGSEVTVGSENPLQLC